MSGERPWQLWADPSDQMGSLVLRNRRLEDALATARARNGRLEEALAPFARFRCTPDQERHGMLDPALVWHTNHLPAGTFEIAMGDFHRARSAMGGAAAMQRAFDASPEEMGRAAVEMAAGSGSHRDREAPEGVSEAPNAARGPLDLFRIGKDSLPLSEPGFLAELMKAAPNVDPDTKEILPDADGVPDEVFEDILRKRAMDAMDHRESLPEPIELPHALCLRCRLVETLTDMGFRGARMERVVKRVLEDVRHASEELSARARPMPPEMPMPGLGKMRR